jgi:Peptidase C39 family
MTVTLRGRFLVFTFPLLVASLPFGTGTLHAQATGSAHPPSPDCGTVALYLLLHAEGHKTSLRDVQSLLPGPASAGRSMKDLRDGARALGMSLRGVVLPRKDGAIDRPMIVFLKRRPGGHFVFVRPVGHTGKLVQAIDPSFATAVMDKADLFAMPEWTGLALVPCGDRRLLWAGCGLFVAAAIATVLPRGPKRKRGRS